MVNERFFKALERESRERERDVLDFVEKSFSER